MLANLLCKVNLGHHWLAESTTDGRFRRRCTKCGKYDARGENWSGRLDPRDHPHEPGESMPAPPY